MISEKRRHLLITPFFAILGRAGGIIIPFILAYLFGAGKQTDAFFLAFSLLISLAGLFTPVLETMLVPYLAELQKLPEKAARLANGVLGISLPVVAVISIVIGLSLKPLLQSSTGLSDDSVVLTVRLYFEMLPFLILSMMTASANGIFHTHKIFWYPAVSPALRSLVVILFLFFMNRSWGIHSASWGFFAGEILRWGVGLLLLIKVSGWRWQVDWLESGSKIRQFMQQAGYQAGGLLFLNLIPVTDQWFASWLGTGKLSILSYSDRLFQIPTQLMMSGVLQVFLSYWAGNFHQDAASFWKKSRRDIHLVFWGSVALSVIFIVFRRFIVALIYGWGDTLSEQELQQVSDLFGWLMVGFSAAALNLLYVRVLFVLKKSSVFCFQSFIRFLLNIIFNALFMHWWGLNGLAISTSAVFIATTLWLDRDIKKYEKQSQEIK